MAPEERIVLAVLAGIAAFASVGGVRLRPWARWPMTLTACVGLLGFPLGTLLNGAFLYILWSAKGRRVLSPDYAALIAATPHVQKGNGRPRWLKVLAGVLLVFFVVMLILAVVLASRETATSP